VVTLAVAVAVAFAQRVRTPHIDVKQHRQHHTRARSLRLGER
jgi:hypothetical protein